MPHCVIEYASTLKSRLDISQLMIEVYQGALASTLFEPEQIKVRVLDYEHYYQPQNNLEFIHITVSILSGRNDEQKQFLASQILKHVKAQISEQISTTIDIRDLNSACYRKYVSE